MALDMDAAVAEVRAELARQHAKWGDQSGLPDVDPHDIPEVIRNEYAFRAQCWKEINDRRAERGCEVSRRDPSRHCMAWDGILLEEVYEALAEDSRTDEGELRLRAELVQVAAVVIQQIDAIDRRRARRQTVEQGGGE